MERNFQHLWNLSEQVSFKKNNSLQSHYLLECKELEEVGVYELPPKLFSELIMCKFCFNVWNSGKLNMKILPQHKPGKKMMKLLQKRKFNKSLTKCELSLLEKYDNSSSNKISLLCLLCHKRSNLLLRKPLPVYSKINEAEILEEDSNILTKKKKKKKKDPFAGLNRSVCTPKSAKQKFSRCSNTKTPSESVPNSSKQSLRLLKTANGNTKPNQKMRNSLTPYSSPLSSRPLKSKGLQKLLFQDKSKSKASPLNAFLADL